MAVATQWRSRIVGHGEEAPDQLLANPANWRIHPKPQQDALAGVLDQVGWVQDVIVNRVTGHVIDGHLRVSLAIGRREPSVPVVYVELEPAEEALILATIDPLAAMAATDREQLAVLLEDVSTGDAALQAMLDSLAQDAGFVPGDAGDTDEEDDTYSRAIESPIYEPTGPKPSVDALYSEDRTRELAGEIEAAEGLTDDERRFLLAAAQRHTVFHFGKIAEYYAHADEGVQALMERSALVIIDFDQAIEMGYARLGERVAELYGIDHPDA
jgi:hypothetical protein